MTFVIDYEFRPGCEYICYLPRLKGAAAIPTLTLRNFRESCSANCVHPWKPKPPPPKPPTPPVDPLQVYKYHYMQEKLSMSTGPILPRPKFQTEHDDIIREVLGHAPIRLLKDELTVEQKAKLALKRQKSSQIMIGRPLDSRVSQPILSKARNIGSPSSRATIADFPTRVSRSTIRGISTVEDPPKKRTSTLVMTKDTTPKYVSWNREIPQLKSEIQNEEKKMKRDEISYWNNIDTKSRKIQKLNDSYIVLTDHYKGILWNKCNEYKGNEKRRTTLENKKKSELESIKVENERLEKEILSLKQYTRIGSTVAKMKIHNLKDKIKKQKEETQFQLDNPPYVAPEIVIPDFDPLPEPRVTKMLEKMKNVAYDSVKLATEEVSEKMTQVEKSKREIHDLKKSVTRIKALDPNEIPTFDIPMRRDIRL